MMLKKGQYWGAVSWTYDMHSHAIFSMDIIFLEGKKECKQNLHMLDLK